MKEQNKVKESKDPLQQSPEKYWEEVIRTNKFNIKGEKSNIDKFEKGKELLAKRLKETETGLDLDLEETKLMKKLYPKYGKDYENTDEFKKFFVKKLNFIIKNINNKIKTSMDEYKYQLKMAAQSTSESERLIKEYQGNLREAKVKTEGAIKDNKKMFG